MLSQNIDHERLSKARNALPEILKTHISQLEVPDLLGQIIKRIVGLAEQANVDSTMFWD